MIQKTERTNYLLWKAVKHTVRLVVGELIEICEGQYMFRYLSGNDLDEAKNLKFSGYPGFPDFDKEYTQNVIEAFSARLPARSRGDFQRFLDYWEIEDPDISDFDLLSITGGQLQTDHFEFVDPHETKRSAQFLSELAGFVHYAADSLLRSLERGTPLQLEPEPDNKWDVNAVKVLHQGERMGYIKKIHARTISNAIKEGQKVFAEIKNSEVNGVVNSILLKIKINPL